MVRYAVANAPYALDFNRNGVGQRLCDRTLRMRFIQLVPNWPKYGRRNL